MKRLLKYIFLLTLILLIFNTCFVHAEETNGNLSNETQNIEVDKEDDSNATITQPELEPTVSPNDTNTTIEVNPVNESNETTEVIPDENTTTGDVEGNITLSDDSNSTVTVDENSTDGNIHGGEIYDIQKVKVIISKVGPDGKPVAGATLQILDSERNLYEGMEWVSDGKDHIVFLPDGDYFLHEVSAPLGYEIADDVPIHVEVKVADVTAGVDFVDFPCPDYGGTPMYYVEIAGEKQEVYCINQGWETPDSGSIYDGEILDPVSIRDYTKQTTPVGIDSSKVSEAIMSDGPIDVSDPSLTDEELYNKILNIIYHRNIARSVLGQRGLTYSDEELRYITEVALKNYTNPGIAELQYGVRATAATIAAMDAAGVYYKRYQSGAGLAENENGNYLSYLKYNYRNYVYVPDSALGQDIVRVDYGKGNSFGQMVAGHFNYTTRYLYDENGEVLCYENGTKITVVSHDAKNKQAERDQVARYYELYLFLISDEETHPDDMNLYIYSSDSTPISELSKYDHDGKYQNLLGVTGYYEKVEQQELKVEMQNNYSITKEISVEKVWEDNNNYFNLRPNDVTIELYANGELVSTITLNDVVGWEYTWTGLPVYENNEEIVYTVKEQKVPKYNMEIFEKMENFFVVTNSYFGDNPKTADPIVYYIVIFILSLFGLYKSYKKLYN